ncbi:MAG: transketolase [Acidobacteria bacterium]|nr:MAG: transketolase [Acidobacteriota bacterium]
MSANVQQIETTKASELDQLCVNTIRTLSIDAIQKANSGHPGAPMGLAPVAYVLWDRFLRYNPANPRWANRDRVLLSAGHASMLLYSMLHLTGYDLPLSEIKNFRQLGSKCPGHPEYNLTPGVEITTGPLGQGVANSVGMAITERWLAAHFNQNADKIFDYRVYAICSDGDMMEGISHEAAALAGHLKLSNLIWLYDSNHISLDGPTSLAYTDDVESRFKGYHWNVLTVEDANDLKAMEAAIRTAQSETTRPTLIIVHSHIGYGSPNKQDKSAAHGEPLGVEEVKATKRFYGWPEDAQFLIPEKVSAHMGKAVERGKKLEAEWQAKYEAWAKKNPELAQQWDAIATGKLPEGWDKDIPVFPADAKGLATREAGSKVLNAIAAKLPWIMGGSADLESSNKTRITSDTDFQSGNYGGRVLRFGVREMGMGAILNGIAASGMRAFGGTFMVFSDYMRAAVRLAAVMELPVTYVFTHDSIAVGEDGPTHEPVEQIMSLRVMPHMRVIRPADANETAVAWKLAVESKSHPTALALTRQAVPTFDRSKYGSAEGLRKGAYIFSDVDGTPDVILIGTGSELQLALQAQEKLAAEGLKARVVSMPCWDLFDEQTAEYKESVLPRAVRARVAVEAGAPIGWEHYVGLEGRVVGQNQFGASAPAKEVFKHFNFTAENVVAKARESLAAVSK